MPDRILSRVGWPVMACAAAVIGWSVVGQPRAGSGSVSTFAVPAEAVSIRGAQSLGATDAPAGTDSSFPTFSVLFAVDLLPKSCRYLQQKYVQKGLLKIVFRNFPLPIHPMAEQAAVAAECAGAQGRFWTMHDRLYSAQEDLSEPYFIDAGRSMGLNEQKFRSCMTAGGSAQIANDASYGETLGVRATPTFLAGVPVDGGTVRVKHVMVGVGGPDAFDPMIEPLVHQEP